MIKRVYLEISNVCNLKCSFCNDTHLAKRVMSIEEIKKVLPKIKECTDYIYLHVKGEPLCHPYFIEIMDLMQTFEMKVQLVTNGTFINNYMTLLNYSCLRKISFSLHSLPFQAMSTHEYISNILDFVKLASKQGYPNCELRFWNKDNLDEQSKEALKLIQESFPTCILTNHHNYKLDEHIYLHFDSKFEWPSNANNDKHTGNCYGAKNMLAILADGTVVPCCLDDEGQIPLGNVFNQSLSEIMKCDRYQKMILGFSQNKCSEELCKKCTYRSRFD